MPCASTLAWLASSALAWPPPSYSTRRCAWRPRRCRRPDARGPGPSSCPWPSLPAPARRRGSRRRYPPETGWPAGPLVQAVPGSPALWLGAALWLGVASTLPVALPLLAAQEVTSWRRLADGWRYVVVLLLVVAAVAVPSSALGLLILVALPLPLYGLGVVLARLTAARGGRG